MNLAIRFYEAIGTTGLKREGHRANPSLSEHLAPLYCDEKAGEKLNA